MVTVLAKPPAKTFTILLLTRPISQSPRPVGVCLRRAEGASRLDFQASSPIMLRELTGQERDMKIGVAYYPEHWPEERWAVDARMMARMKIDVARVGEFAWSRLEPRRERFDMDWLQRAVQVLADHGLKVILCTPTAAPPPWLFQRHPTILPQRADGRRWYAGSRRHVCLSHPAYQKYARRIVSELAGCFDANPHVYAWQVDNELGLGGSGVCYCSECEQAFRKWLKRCYGTLERLNTQWGTAFWSQGFADWHEIPAPRETPAGSHPSLLLDYKRFVSAQYRMFVEEQRDLIRQHAGEEAVVTTNSPGPLAVPHINLFSLATAQDVTALDNYPADASRLEVAALQLDLVRSLKRKPFWVLEQQAGATIIPGHAAQPRPGQLRLWSYQAASRGAELMVYFRWRTCAFGQEMHWYGMLDSNGTPRRRFEELRGTIAELKEHAGLWEGRLPEADVAIMLDYDSAWALEATPLGAELDYFGLLHTFYSVLRRIGAQADFVQPGAELSDYAALIVPMPFICTDELARQLETYTHQGGRVLVTAPAGYKTPANTASGVSPPGELTRLLGVEIVEYDVLNPGAVNSIELEGGAQSFPTGRFCSVMQLRGARTLGTYGAQFYAGSPAVTARTEGKGEAFFVGAACGPECYETLLRQLFEDGRVRLWEWASPSVEVVPLKGAPEEPRLTFVLNHSGEPVTLALPQEAPVTELLTNRHCQDSLTLGGYEVALLKF